MKLIISFCAPAVMDSIATTAPTPKIMPSMVSRLRSLCAKRLASPILISGRTCKIPMVLFASRHAHGVARTGGVFLIFVLFARLVGRRIHHGDDVVRLNAACQHHRGLAALQQLHFVRLELSVCLPDE